MLPRLSFSVCAGGLAGPEALPKLTSQFVSFLHSVFHNRVRLRRGSEPTMVSLGQEVEKAAE